MFNYRIDWIDTATGAHCIDWLTRESAIREVKGDVLGEIFSVTEIIDDEGNESENLLEIFRNL